MKKTFLARRNALLSPANLSWSSGALLFALIVLLLRLLAPNVFFSVFSPVLRSADSLAAVTHKFISSYNDTATLALQNEALSNQNAALAAENQALVLQVQSISSLLGTTPAERHAAEGIIASVATRPPQSLYDTLLIAAGSVEGVTTGMEAFGAGGVPIGVVTGIDKHYARVTLFSAPRIMTNGWVGRSLLPITIRGEGGGSLSASVARTAPVGAGDSVYTSGPGMLPMGSVVRIDSDPSSSTAILRIQSAQNMFSLGWVTVRDVGTIPLRALTTATSTIL